MTVRTFAIAMLMFTLACGGDDEKADPAKAGGGDERAADGTDGDKAAPAGGGVGAGAGVAAAPAGAAGAAPARSLFGGKFAGVFGKATAGAKPQSAGDLTAIFGSKLPTLTPALAGMGVAGAPGAPADPNAAPAAPAPGGGPGAGLWAFAPPDAAFGIVAADGSLTEVASAVATMSKTAAASPGANLILGEVAAQFAALGVDPTNPAAWAQGAGIDLSKGFAMFASTAGNVVVVLPVSDPAAFRKAVKDDDGDLDDKHCVAAQGRYICAPQLDYAKGAAAPHDSPLATRAAQLPAWLKGDIEVVTHLGSFPGAVQELAQLSQMMTNIGTLAAVANLDNGSLSVRAWLEGKRSGAIGDAFAAIPPATLTGESAGATNLFHMRLPWQFMVGLMGLPPTLQLAPGAPDLRADLIDNLTGEVVTYSRGDEFLAEHLTLALRDAAKGARAIEFLCDVAIQSKMVPGLKKGTGSCSGTLKLKELLAKNPDMKPFVDGMPAIPVAVQVTGQNLELKVGWPGAAGGATGDMAGSDIARELMTGNWNFVMWGMGFDPLAVAPGPLQKKLTAVLAQGMRGAPQAAAGMAMLRWMYGHVYDAGIAWGLRDDGMYLLAQVTTYAGDPPDALAGHQKALTAMVNGDYGAYKKLSGQLAKSYPQTLAGRHGAGVAKGVSMLGQFGVWGVGMFAGLVAGGKKDAMRAEPAMIPPTPVPGGPVTATADDPETEKLMVKFADEVCKCKDMACFQKVGMEIGMKMAGKRPSMNSPKTLAAMQKMSQCAAKLQQ